MLKRSQRTKTHGGRGTACGTALGATRGGTARGTRPPPLPSRRSGARSWSAEVLGTKDPPVPRIDNRPASEDEVTDPGEDSDENPEEDPDRDAGDDEDAGEDPEDTGEDPEDAGENPEDAGQDPENPVEESKDDARTKENSDVVIIDSTDDEIGAATVKPSNARESRRMTSIQRNRYTVGVVTFADNHYHAGPPYYVYQGI